MIRAAKESFRYCALLILLLTMAAVAVAVTINFLDNAVPNSSDRLYLTIAIWTLTLGFMLIAGAFGLWTIHFATEAASLRSISRLVDHLDNVRDAIIALDRQGRIIGMNAAAESVFGKVRGLELPNICHAVSLDDMQSFLHTNLILEHEFPFVQENHPTRTLRFRVQPPISGVSLILVSDITSLTATRTRQRQASTLQLAAHLAQGIANDFNDLLCGISGHASLLQRPDRKPQDIQNSAIAIQQCADRGIWLARELTQLSHSNQDGAMHITVDVVRHVSSGAELLAANLDANLHVQTDLVEYVSPVNLPPVQIEHITQSLGLIVAESIPNNEGTLCIRLRLPDETERVGPKSHIVAMLEIEAISEQDVITEHHIKHHNPENGVISSLVQTLIVQAGGQFQASPDGRKARLFRIYLPEVDPESLSSLTETEETLAVGLEAYTAGWNVLLCMQTHQNVRILDYLKSKRIHIRTAMNENDFLQALASKNQCYDVMFIQPDLLGQHFDSFLPIINRINPEVAVVLLVDKKPNDLSETVVTIKPCSPPHQWIQAMIDARSRVKLTTTSHLLNESHT